MPLVVNVIVAEPKPHTVVTEVPATVIGVVDNTPTVVVTLQTPEVMVAVKVFRPDTVGVKLTGLVVCPELHAKPVPLVIRVTLAGIKPHTELVLMLLTVITGWANTLTTVVTLQTPEVIVAL